MVVVVEARRVRKPRPVHVEEHAHPAGMDRRYQGLELPFFIGPSDSNICYIHRDFPSLLMPLVWNEGKKLMQTGKIPANFSKGVYFVSAKQYNKNMDRYLWGAYMCAETMKKF